MASTLLSTALTVSFARAIVVTGFLGLFASATALGATSLDEARRASTVAREQVETLRQRQTALRQQLNATGDRIAQLKASGRRVIGNATLEAELRRSQELSTALGGLATEIATAEAEADAKDLALVESLAQTLNSVRAEAERTQDRTARAGLYARMRTLRAERDQRRGALRASPLPTLRDAQGDDPEDLLEQADAFRDAEDKLRARLAVLDARISEAVSERELDRRMREFAEDEAIFDEQDRRFDRGSTSGRGASGAVADEAASLPEGGSPVAGAPFSTRSSVAGSASPDMLGDEVSAPSAAGPLDTLGGLEAERARLRGLADELARKAKDAEQRARRLDTP